MSATASGSSAFACTSAFASTYSSSSSDGPVGSLSGTVIGAVTGGSGSKGKRWFDNPYPDFDPECSEVEFDKAAIKAHAIDLLEVAFIRGVASGEGGVYVGANGVSYTAVHIGHTLTAKERQKYYALAINAFQNQKAHYAVKNVGRNELCGLLLGKGGFFLIGTMLGQEMGNSEFANGWINNYVHSAAVCKPIDFLKHGSDDLFVGRAGYLAGALWLQQKIGIMPIPKQDLYEVWNSIIASGKNYSEAHSSPCPLMYSYYGTEYLGAGHGLASILQILMSFPIFMKENQAAGQMIKDTVYYFLTLQTEDGNFPCAMDEVGPNKEKNPDDMLVHWCHGAPGVAYMLAKAYHRFKDRKFLNACIKCGELVWTRGLLRKGPGLCHGIAGNGYVFLLLYNLTDQKEPKYLYRAVKFAEFLKRPEFLKEARRPDSPWSLYEGNAGAVCFLLDILDPERAEFPFMSVNLDYKGDKRGV